MEGKESRAMEKELGHGEGKNNYGGSKEAEGKIRVLEFRGAENSQRGHREQEGIGDDAT